MKLIFILLFSFFFEVSSNQAQTPLKDYIITVKGDTVAVKIENSFWTGKVVYRLPGSKTITRMDDGNVKEYHWSAKKNLTFVAIILPTEAKPTFATLLVKGRINLYEVISHTSKSSTKYWYASKANLPVVEIANQKRLFGIDKHLVQNLTTLLSDNKQVITELNSEQDYRFQTFKNLIQQYDAL